MHSSLIIKDQLRVRHNLGIENSVYKSDPPKPALVELDL